MTATSLVDRACTLHERAVQAAQSGHAREALRHARRALALFIRVDGPASGDAANVLVEISAAEQALGNYDAALDAASRAWRILAPVRSRDPVVRRLRANVLGRLAAISIVRGDYASARRAARRAHGVATQLDPADRVSAAMMLGVACKHAGRYADAAKAYAQVGELTGPATHARATLFHNLAGLAHARGRFAEGVKLARRGVALRERLVGRTHPDVADDLAALAPLLHGAGQTRAAAQAYRRALRLHERRLGAHHLEVGLLVANLGALEHRRGRWREAERLYRRALRIVRRRVGDRHPQVAITLHHLALLRRERA